MQFIRALNRPVHLLSRQLRRSGPPSQRCHHRSHPVQRRPASTTTSHLRRKDLPTADTIYALSTAPGRAAIAIIRISGPACLDIYGSLCPNRPFPIPRVATLRKLYAPQSSEGDNNNTPPAILDSGALVLYFPAPSTATGEDILELHLHGGPAIIGAVLSAIPHSHARDRRRTAHYSTIRHAEPGEFTKRAFYNGRVSLPEAEALGQLLSAETEQQRRLAVLGAESGLAERYEGWRQMLLYARGELEALIDFSEDQHFDESPAKFLATVSSQVTDLQNQLRLHIRNASRGELLRSGIRVALLGAPNAGKSSLLNQIVGREAAIVSAEEGTTRDIVDVCVDLNGWLVRLGDMAGLRTTTTTSTTTSPVAEASIGEIEKEGIRRARARALDSDVVIVLLSLEPNADGTIGLQINDEVRGAATECQANGKTLVVVINKSDLIPGLESSAATMAAMRRYVYNAFPGVEAERVCFLSCKDAAASPSASASASAQAKSSSDPGSLQAFLSSLTETFQTLTFATATTTDADSTADMSPAEAAAYWNASLSVTHRQTTYLTECVGHLEDFLAQAQASNTHENADLNNNDHDGEEAEVDIVTAAEYLRFAASCLAKITGRGESGDVEDVLGVVFEK